MLLKITLCATITFWFINFSWQCRRHMEIITIKSSGEMVEDTPCRFETEPEEEGHHPKLILSPEQQVKVGTIWFFVLFEAFMAEITVDAVFKCVPDFLFEKGFWMCTVSRVSFGSTLDRLRNEGEISTRYSSENQFKGFALVSS